MELIKEYPHVTMLDADDMVWKVVREAAENGIISETLQNNYYVYEVESILRDWDNTFFKFHLVRRRTACKECLELYDALRNIVANENAQ